ncbi:TPA: hypothetical protein HA238_00650, partial [Candidatus Micrarchaeota archaeon]|nr:hypothetical protein [Candidatus Micrarchaeota archaeon]
MQPEIQRAWDKTCALLLGEKLGNIEDYSEWLKELIDKNTYRKSSISGKEVAFAIPEYCKGSKAISFDEIDFGKRFEPLNINEIKDIDSILEAVNERVYYCGNILLGNSENVERSSNLSDGFAVTDSAQFFKVKYMAYCTVGREDSYCFGVHGPGGSEFLIRCSQTVNVRRSFELWVSTNTSDCYYSYGLDNCSNCLFSFNLKNKRNCIGNLELARDKYDEIKKKLLAELVIELKKNKSAPSLMDIVRRCKAEKPFAPRSAAPESKESNERFDKQVIEREFFDTTKIIFGKPLTGMDNYSEWLCEHTHKMQEAKSAISGKKILWLPYGISLLPVPDDRIVTLLEARHLGETATLAPSEAENITLKNAHGSIGKIAYFKVDVKEGENSNLIDCSFCIQCSNCYKTSMMVRSKNCAFGMWPKDSTNCFGMDSLMDSNFCVKCYHSTKLTRCFEMDNCRDCADSMFCHNCESLSNSMFCFNVK